MMYIFSIINTDERYEEKDMIYNAVSDLNLKHTEVGIKKIILFRV